MANAKEYDEITDIKKWMNNKNGGFERKQAAPLDKTNLFLTLEDAQAYASVGTDERHLSNTAYAGQTAFKITLQNIK